MFWKYTFQMSTAGTAGGANGTYLYSLPAGITIDTSVVTVNNTPDNSSGSADVDNFPGTVVGSGSIMLNGANLFTADLMVYSSTQLWIRFMGVSSNVSQYSYGSNYLNFTHVPISLSLSATIPIV